MATFVALYSQADDPQGFEEHYRTRHMEIIDRWPGVQSASVTRFSGTPRGGESPYSLMAVVTFATDEDMAAAFRSEAGAESVEDVKEMSKRFGVTPTLLLGDDFGS